MTNPSLFPLPPPMTVDHHLQACLSLDQSNVLLLICELCLLVLVIYHYSWDQNLHKSRLTPPSLGPSEPFSQRPQDLVPPTSELTIAPGHPESQPYPPAGPQQFQTHGNFSQRPQDLAQTTSDLEPALRSLGPQPCPSVGRQQPQNTPGPQTYLPASQHQLWDTLGPSTSLPGIWIHPPVD